MIMARKPASLPRTAFVICLHNGDEADMIVHKLYRRMPDPIAQKAGFIRVVDESREDYLYPAHWFAAVSLSPTILRRVRENIAAQSSVPDSTLSPSSSPRRR
jgi:hypothetical protein